MLSTPRPLAVGLLQADAAVSRRDLLAARVRIALAVNERGYALLEVLASGGSAAKDNEALAFVEELAHAHDVQLLVLSGVGDEAPARRLADRARLAVWVLDLACR